MVIRTSPCAPSSRSNPPFLPKHSAPSPIDSFVRSSVAETVPAPAGKAAAVPGDLLAGALVPGPLGFALACGSQESFLPPSITLQRLENQLSQGQGSGLQLTELPPFNSRREARWGQTLTDIMQHEAPDDSNPYTDLITKGHETCHGINNWLMNNGQPPDGGDGRWHLQIGLYLLGNRSVVIWEPDLKKDRVAEQVPQSLRGSRFDHYVAGQPAWNDHPLYLWDEWTAYVNGTEVGLDQLQAGKWTQGRRIAALGPLEFTVYALATGKAISENDPQRWQEDTQLRELLAFNSRRAMTAVLAAQETEEFNHPNFEAYLANFWNSPDAEGLRAFARDQFGAEFCREVYGF